MAAILEPKKQHFEHENKTKIVIFFVYKIVRKFKIYNNKSLKKIKQGKNGFNNCFQSLNYQERNNLRKTLGSCVLST